MSDVCHIRLWEVVPDCAGCGEPVDGNYFVWRFEDTIVPDDYPGERGGTEVCDACYFEARGRSDDFTKPILFSSLSRAGEILEP